jgi:hypothetical protein
VKSLALEIFKTYREICRDRKIHLVVDTQGEADVIHVSMTDRHERQHKLEITPPYSVLRITAAVDTLLAECAEAP